MLLHPLITEILFAKLLIFLLSLLLTTLHLLYIPYKMVEQNLSVSRTVSDELMLRALNLGLEQITQYGVLYREAINGYKTKHFEDRSQVCYSYFVISSCSKPRI